MMLIFSSTCGLDWASMGGGLGVVGYIFEYQNSSTGTGRFSQHNRKLVTVRFFVVFYSFARR